MNRRQRRAMKKRIPYADRLSRAAHEAGHAVAAELLGFRVRLVSMGGVGRKGRCEIWAVKGSALTPDGAKRAILQLWAGPAGEKLIAGTVNISGRQSDERDARGVAAAAGIRYATTAAIAWQERALELLTPHASKVRAVAEALVERGELDGDSVRRVMASTGTGATFRTLPTSGSTASEPAVEPE